jgi:superfamily II DNA or RNA helicase
MPPRLASFRRGGAAFGAVASSSSSSSFPFPGSGGGVGGGGGGGETLLHPRTAPAPPGVPHAALLGGGFRQPAAVPGTFWASDHGAAPSLARPGPPAAAAAAPAASSAAIEWLTASFSANAASDVGAHPFSVAPAPASAPSARHVPSTSSSSSAASASAASEARQRRLRFHSDLLRHALAFREYHQRRKMLTRRVAVAAARRFHEAEKERKSADDKDERRRLRALKENNLAAYLELARQKKDERVTFLLEQTDSYLASLQDLIARQKEAAEQFDIDAREMLKATAAVEAARAERRRKHQAKLEERARVREAAAAARSGWTGGGGAGVGADPSSAGDMGGDAAAEAMESDGEEEGGEEEEETAPTAVTLISAPALSHESMPSSASSSSSASMDTGEGGAGAGAGAGGGAGAGAGARASSSASSSSADPIAGSAPTTTDYYVQAHTQSERVREQPRMVTGGTLQPYQVAGVEWLVSLYNNRLNGILADEMGLGKTIQTISLLAHLMERKNNKGPFFVCVPLSTLSNWKNEFARWAPGIRVAPYMGTAAERKVLQQTVLARGEFNVLLTTYDFALRDASRLTTVPWQYIIVDEGHRLKNANSRLTLVLGQEYSSRYRLLLTGTPLQNSLPELWSLLNFLLPKVFGSVDDFEAWFSRPFSAYKGPGQGSGSGAGGAGAGPDGGGAVAQSLSLTAEEKLLIIARLHAILRPFLLRRVKSQVLTQLPPKVEYVVRCELSAWQRLQYTQVQRYGCVPTDPEEVAASGAAAGDGTKRALNNLLTQLRKVVNHPFLLCGSHAVDDSLWRSSGKFELLDRLLPKLKATGHRALIFSQTTSLLDILEEYLEMCGHTFLRLDGRTPAAEREESMRLFNAPDSPFFLFLLSTRAGGLGINLATADTVILFDSDWNPTADAQAQDRAHRIGQLRQVRVLRLVTVTPFEEMVVARAHDKATMEALVIEAGKFEGGDEGGEGGGKGEERRKLLEEMIRTELDAPRKGPAQRGGKAAAAGGAAAPAPRKRGRPRKVVVAAAAPVAVENKEDGGVEEMGVNDTPVSGGGDGGGDEGVGQEESAVPDDESLNEMIARSQEEFKLFQRMDVERTARERAEGKPWAAGLKGPSAAATKAPGPSESTVAASSAASSASSSGTQAAANASSRADDDNADEEDLAAASAAAADVAASTRARLLREEEVPAWARLSKQEVSAIQSRLSGRALVRASVGIDQAQASYLFQSVGSEAGASASTAAADGVSDESGGEGSGRKRPAAGTVVIAGRTMRARKEGLDYKGTSDRDFLNALAEEAGESSGHKKKKKAKAKASAPAASAPAASAPAASAPAASAPAASAPASAAAVSAWADGVEEETILV